MAWSKPRKRCPDYREWGCSAGQAFCRDRSSKEPEGGRERETGWSPRIDYHKTWVLLGDSGPSNSEEHVPLKRRQHFKVCHFYNFVGQGDAAPSANARCKRGFVILRHHSTSVNHKQNRAGQQVGHEGQMALGRNKEVSTAFKQAAVIVLPTFSTQTKPRLKHVCKQLVHLQCRKTGGMEKTETRIRTHPPKAETRVII